MDTGNPYTGIYLQNSLKLLVRISVPPLLLQLLVMKGQRARTFLGMISIVTIATLPETNMSPENRSLEKEIPIGNHHF